MDRRAPDPYHYEGFDSLADAQSRESNVTAEKINVITGATGQLGSHIAEQLREQGEHVRALVRPGSDTTFLQSIGVDLAHGDLLDPASIRRALEGASIVYHCAARVSDWGAWPAFQKEAVDS